ncbi:hypothetical protein AB1Y20_020031 [Prymnesium parvum]|uniref:Asp23/Gls24 family envelope stress response protein n=1 Tax=Prymnesium parvum TaxID=97485 RepID=A0AB34JWW1_PRYPA
MAVALVCAALAFSARALTRRGIEGSATYAPGRATPPQPGMPSIAAFHPACRISTAVRARHHSIAMNLVLTEENVALVLADCMAELGTLFGSNSESLQVGITGKVEFVELDGPVVVVRLAGRFWHQRSDVLARVERYVQDRIPECIAVEVEDESQLDDSDPPSPSSL